MRGLRIAGAIIAALGFAVLAPGLLIFAVIYAIALFEGDSETAPWIFAVGAIVFLALTVLSGWMARFCALGAIHEMQN